MTARLPILDLSRFDAGRAERDGFLADLRAAVRDVGFFYLSGHGIPDDLATAAWAEAHRFFDLPQGDKDAIDMVNSPHFRGYTRAGAERTRGQPDWREQLDVGTERFALPRTDDAPAWTRLPGPNQWPAAQPALRDALLAWQEAATAVAIRLLRAFALALGQAADAFDPIFAETPNQHLKIIRYPGRSPDDPAGAEGRGQGVGAHKDSGLLTLLLQDDQGGLQVETADGWVDAVPIPGTFIINAGELLELATDGYIRATVHRVVAPPAGAERTSIAFFLGARLDARMPLLTLPPELKAEARGLSSDPLNPLFRDIGANYMKGRLRSHPDVARRHYADLPEVAALPQAGGYA
ncbi:isopenicillin N synthase family dioxygenase [Nitrospirillum sp. BR 11163]|uniref:isopenicillin N synthase family dioxygenase n=1 Tax=Nitrospirillum sp. BR 11163 TaxID=3104323 RepID=UPI002AFF9C38|nr:2-oxoglutarate and iron-dependent oxygenase domain-containing protein [Nitrospirillum sp. BR 11163]MEA1674658.1 2-oxoglutarate and iron-dependent oxygenase domain-containing protein [Nitrospirillum sp. BR 11163]